MSASQRRKGSNGELECCALLNAEFGVNVRRKLGQARDSGNDIDLPPFAIEVKRRARIGQVYEWMDQAELAAAINETPAILCRADGRDWLAILRFVDFARLAREEIACGGKSSVTMRFDPYPATGGSPSSASATAAATPSTPIND